MAFAYNGVSLATTGVSTAIFPFMSGGAQLGQMPHETVPITSLGLLCTVTGSLTYSVQISCDNPEEPPVNWLNHDIIANQTAGIFSNIAFPVSAVRLNVTSWTSGTVNLGIVQWP